MTIELSKKEKRDTNLFAKFLSKRILDWIFSQAEELCLKSVKIFEKRMAKELRVRASLKFLKIVSSFGIIH